MEEDVWSIVDSLVRCRFLFLNGFLMLPSTQNFYYPFTAIVGQEMMKRALLLNAINPNIGGVLIRGPSGTAKSTAVRALSELLPDVDVVEDCPFHCDPNDYLSQCDLCRKRMDQGEEFVVRRRPRLLVNLPLNATEDRVAGTLDITFALRDGIKAFQPGLLAEANRGILYVDEINLLDDHIIDILLDAAALGVNLVEREGISVRHPARFLLVGTMNPEEGELRPQILDRIGLQVEAKLMTDRDQRVEVMKRRDSFFSNPRQFIAGYESAQNQYREAIQRAVGLVDNTIVPERFYEAVAELSLKLEVMSHRADIVMVQCAKAQAALEGRTQVNEDDLLQAVGLAIGHRLNQDPFTPGARMDEPMIRREMADLLAAKEKKSPVT